MRWAQQPIEHTEPITITMADGQTFDLIPRRPTMLDRFQDDGMFLVACDGKAGAWAAYRAHRLKCSIAGWSDVTDEQGKAIPFSIERLLGLLDHDPSILDQVQEVANKAFAPFVKPATSSAASRPDDSGEVKQPEQPAISSTSN